MPRGVRGAPPDQPDVRAAGRLRTSVGYGDGPGGRRALGLPGRGPVLVITDLGILAPDPATCALRLTHLHPGVTAEQVRAATGWDLAVAPDLADTPPPTDGELAALRTLTKRSSTVTHPAMSLIISGQLDRVGPVRHAPSGRA